MGKHLCCKGAGGKPCNRVRLGQPYDITQDCRSCWLFHHDITYNLAWGGDGKVFVVVGEPVPKPPPLPPVQLLGDRVKDALEGLGITQERVQGITDWLGVHCGCRERQEKLNKLDLWAREAAGHSLEKAKELLGKLIGW